MSANPIPKLNPFIKQLDEYTSLINPIGDAVKQSAKFYSKTNDVKLDVAEKMVRKLFKVSKSIKNPKVKYYERGKNGDKQLAVGSLHGYITSTMKNKDIMVPSLTTYINHNVELSTHVEYIFNNVKARSAYKKEALEYKTAGNFEQYTIKDVLQRRKKISNNSLSGSYASAGTVLNNISAHYTLTSITRCVASLGNAVAESMIAGNRHYYKPDVVLNDITSIITNTDMMLIREVLMEFKLHVPTVDELMSLIRYSTDLYFENESFYIELRTYLETLDELERCAVAYVNDLYHLRELNPEYLKEFVDDMSTPKRGLSKDLEADIKIIPEHILNQVHHVLADELKGKKVDYTKMIETGETDLIVSTSLSIMEAINKREKLIRAFYVTRNLPIDVANLPNILRRVTVLSDTDSTCATYQEWVEWYYGKIHYSSKSVGITAGVMTIVTQVLDHILKQFTANMNVGKDYLHLLAMKNEFFWLSMTPMDVAKHYFADTYVQEGKVFANTDLEKKGVHMMASKIPTILRNKSTKVMLAVNENISSNKPIDIVSMIKEVANMERYIIKQIKKGDVTVFQSDKIKEASSYSLDEDRSNFIHFKLWQEVFSAKYGEMSPPPYAAITINTIFDKKSVIKKYLENIEDKEISERLETFLRKYNKNALGTMRVPLVIVGERGIPDEIIKAVDVNKIISNNLNIFYMILGSLGFQKPPKLNLIDMGY